MVICQFYYKALCTDVVIRGVGGLNANLVVDCARSFYNSNRCAA